MPQEFPFYTEQVHLQGPFTNTTGNAARDTKTAFDEGRNKLDVRDYISLLEPMQSPLVTLLTQPVKVWDGAGWKSLGLNKQPVIGTYEFKWLEDRYSSRFSKVSAYAVSGDTTITVSANTTEPAFLFTAGDVVKNIRTGEQFIVKSVATSTTITVDANGRAFGSTPAAAMVAGDGLVIIGSANSENATARNVNVTKTKSQSNITQIFRDTVSASGTFKELDLYGGKGLTYDRTKKMTEHKLSIEYAFIFGEKKEDVTGSAGATALSTQGHSLRTTGGVMELITGGDSFIQDQAGNPLTAPDLNNFLGKTQFYGKKKTIMAGTNFLMAVNEIARGQIRTKVGDDTYGINISTWMTPFGEVEIIYNPLFGQEYAGHALLLDMNDQNFVYRFIPNRDTFMRMNIQDPSMDGEVDEILTECGLERHQAPKHSLIYGIGA